MKRQEKIKLSQIITLTTLVLLQFQHGRNSKNTVEYFHSNCGCSAFSHYIFFMTTAVNSGKKALRIDYCDGGPFRGALFYI